MDDRLGQGSALSEKRSSVDSVEMPFLENIADFEECESPDDSEPVSRPNVSPATRSSMPLAVAPPVAEVAIDCEQDDSDGKLEIDEEAETVPRKIALRDKVRPKQESIPSKVSEESSKIVGVTRDSDDAAQTKKIAEKMDEETSIDEEIITINPEETSVTSQEPPKKVEKVPKMTEDENANTPEALKIVEEGSATLENEMKTDKSSTALFAENEKAKSDATTLENKPENSKTSDSPEIKNGTGKLCEIEQIFLPTPLPDSAETKESTRESSGNELTKESDIPVEVNVNLEEEKDRNSSAKTSEDFEVATKLSEPVLASDSEFESS